jgi:hypothetical protein
VQTARPLSASAPQLTSLEVWGRHTPPDYRMAGQTLCHPSSDFWPLAHLGSLKKLVLHGCLCVAPLSPQQPSAVDVPTSSNSGSSSSSSGGGYAIRSCLPFNLQEVVFDRVGILPYWLTHLAGCPQLRKLQVHLWGRRRYAASHPALVAAAVLQHVPGLRSLQLPGWEESGAVVWTAQPPLLTAPAAAGPGAAAVELAPAATGAAAAAAAAAAAQAPLAWRPQGALLGLSGLRNLRADPAAPLVLTTAADWEGLAQMQCLTLLEVRICTVLGVRLHSAGGMFAWGHSAGGESDCLHSVPQARFPACPQWWGRDGRHVCLQTYSTAQRLLLTSLGL